MKTIIEVHSAIETSSAGCGTFSDVEMSITKSTYYFNKIILSIGGFNDLYVDLDDLSNAVSMLMHERELLNDN